VVTGKMAKKSRERYVESPENQLDVRYEPNNTESNWSIVEMVYSLLLPLISFLSFIFLLHVTNTSHSCHLASNVSFTRNGRSDPHWII